MPLEETSAFSLTFIVCMQYTESNAIVKNKKAFNGDLSNISVPLTTRKVFLGISYSSQTAYLLHSNFTIW
jgi:hypothetical protein